MPILDVEMVTSLDEEISEDLASLIADKAAQIFKLPQGRTWVKLRVIPRNRYAEDGGGPPYGVYPVFVSLLLAEFPPEDKIRNQITRLTIAIAKACERPVENIHILYESPAKGRMAFGGELMSS